MRSYLAAKRTVDDRALNRRVLDRFADELATREQPVRIVELGAGIGTMIVRLAEWDLLPDRVSYRAVDRDEDSIARAREHVPDGLERAGYTVDRIDEGDDGWTDENDEFSAREGVDCDRDGSQPPPPNTLVATRERRGTQQRLELTFDVADAFELEDDADAVIAAAFLDLVDLPGALAAIDDVVAPGGLLYAPITFDGGTTFAPADSLDDRIERCYHRHMDEFRDGGSSRAGRELLTALPERGWDVLAAGGADWVVRPVDGAYPAAERTVVARVLETIDGALAALPAVAAADRTQWLDRRTHELERADLVFVAHNLDVLARVP